MTKRGLGRGAGRHPVCTVAAAQIATAAMAPHMERMGAAAGLAVRSRGRYSQPHEGGVRSGAMTTLKRSWTRVGYHIGVWMYRTLDGRLSSGRRNVHVVMIMAPDPCTGIPRSTCVRYLETPAVRRLGH